ncbi:MAG TPA: HD domain-containing protein [Alphaproteobacteria bacterium]
MSQPRDPVTLLARAYALAADRHAGQRRNCAKDEPYLNHLVEVAHLLAYATDGADPVLVAGGVLHDALEDTETTEDELRRLFGDEVAALVAEVTDPPGLGEEARRRRQVDHAPALSARARLLKIADKTSNIRERIAHPPTDLPAAQVRAYIEWGAAVVAGCRGLNERLDAAFDEALALARNRFGA